MKDNFSEIVGQSHSKKRLQFYIDGFTRSSVFPHTMVVAPKGVGKTHLIREVGKVLKNISAEKGGKKHLIEINSSTLKSVKQFIEQIVVNYVQNQDCTLFFDEVHELNPKMVAALLSILNPTKENRTEFRFGDMVFEFNFARVSFFAATTERQKVFQPLLDRFAEIHLDEYSVEEVAEIMKRNVQNNYVADPDALLEMAKYCRGNARSAAMIGGNQGISNYCSSRGVKTFKVADVKKLVEILDLFPLGFSRMEVDMLRAIAKARATSLTALAAKSGLSKPAQQDIEKCFLRYGFIEIEAGHGRSITAKGQEYLKAVEGR